jgi:hypothetical protein
MVPKARLSRMLEMAFDPYGERKKEIVAMMPKELSFNQDGHVKTIKRELLLTEGIESGLIQTAVADVVVEGSSPARCWMDILPVRKIKGNAYVWNYGQAGAYAGTVAEAAEIPNMTQDYTSSTFTSLKYGRSPKISNEMVEDGMVDVIAEEIAYASKCVMLGFEQACNNTMLEGSGDEWDTTTTAGSLGIKAVIKALAQSVGNGFSPDAVIMHPGFEGFILQDVAAPNPDMLNGGRRIPDGYLGLKWRACGVADIAGGTYTWGSGTDGYIMGMVVDSRRAGGIVQSRGLTIKDYDDPVRDLKGMTITMRGDCNAFVSTACVRVEY